MAFRSKSFWFSCRSSAVIRRPSVGALTPVSRAAPDRPDARATARKTRSSSQSKRPFISEMDIAIARLNRGRPFDYLSEAASTQRFSEAHHARGIWTGVGPTQRIAEKPRSGEGSIRPWPCKGCRQAARRHRPAGLRPVLGDVAEPGGAVGRGGSNRYPSRQLCFANPHRGMIVRRVQSRQVPSRQSAKSPSR